MRAEHLHLQIIIKLLYPGNMAQQGALNAEQMAILALRGLSQVRDLYNCVQSALGDPQPNEDERVREMQAPKDFNNDFGISSQLEAFILAMSEYYLDQYQHDSERNEWMMNREMDNLESRKRRLAALGKILQMVALLWWFASFEHISSHRSWPPFFLQKCLAGYGC